MIEGVGRKVRRALLVAGVAGVGALLAPAAALAAPGATGHTVTMTEVTHGVFDAGLSGPNPCTGASIVSVDASGTVLNHVTFFPAGDEVSAIRCQLTKWPVLMALPTSQSEADRRRDDDRRRLRRTSGYRLGLPHAHA
jgi:hypothetical protein